MQFVFRSINAGERNHSAFSSGFRFLHPRVFLDKTNRRSGRDSFDWHEALTAIGQMICPERKM
jgi:hypothetical protein